MNHHLKKLAQFLAYSNLWVGLSVASLTWLSGYFLQSVNYSYIAFTFFATVAFYAYSRFFEGNTLQNGNSKITLWHKKRRKLVLSFAVISVVAAGYLFLQFTHEVWVVIIVASLVSVLYPIPYSLGRWPGIRHIAGFKLFIISVVWTVITFAVPVMQSGAVWDKDIILLFAQRLFLITAITIPFDLRDRQMDHPNINTLPMQLGPKSAIMLAVVAIFMIELSVLLQYFIHGMYSGWQTLGLFLGLEIMMVLVHKSLPLKKDLYYSFWLEGTPIYLSLIVFGFSLF